MRLEDVVLLLFGLGLACAVAVAFPVRAAPLAVAVDESVTVTLHDEPCALPAVSNLPHRATWVEKGATHEGCWGSNGQIVMAYFADRSVVAIPLRSFQKAQGV